MKQYTRNQIMQIIARHNPDHDIGPDCPVTWREEVLALAVLELQEELQKLEAKVSRLMDAVPSARRWND